MSLLRKSKLVDPCRQTRPITSAVSVGDVLNPIRAPGAASITAFTKASSTRVCAGSSRTPHQP